jgi:hypothetical protein
MIISISFTTSGLTTVKAEPSTRADGSDVDQGVRQFDEASKEVESILNLVCFRQISFTESASLVGTGGTQANCVSRLSKDISRCLSYDC